jgi:DDE superfamily endonuclease
MSVAMEVSSLPRAARSLVSQLSIAFTPATFQRVLVLLVGAILAPGRRTVAACLWAARALARQVGGDSSSYRRVFSLAVWDLWPLGKVLAGAVIALVPAEEPIIIDADDTVAQHRGAKVYGKGCHRDAVRSSHSHTVWKWGHKWVVLAINVMLPFCSRPWALPVLPALYRTKQMDEKEGRRHKTPAQLARGMVAVLVRWFPDRRFILLGDGGFGSHELARFFRRRRRHGRNVALADDSPAAKTLISRLSPKANLYAAPPPPPPGKKSRNGRPRVKGDKLPSPEQVVASTPPGKRRRATVGWYGGGKRRVELVSGTGHWYKSGQGLVELRWVFVHDLSGTHRDEYFFCTDATLAPERIVTLYTGRWSIEVTFEEVREWLGFESPRQWVKRSVQRCAPCLLGLFTVIALIYAEHVKGVEARGGTVEARSTDWYHKAEPTFSDAIRCVRRLFWAETVLKHPFRGGGFQNLARSLKNVLLDYLSDAA